MNQPNPNDRPVRVRFPADVDFCGAQFQLREFTANLSVGGAFLPTDQEIEVGSVGKLTFRISQWEAPFTVEAQVVRRFCKDEETHDYPPGIGIQFVDLNHVDRRRLERLVEGICDGSIVEAIRRSIRESGTDIERELRDRPLDQLLILAHNARGNEIDALIRSGNPVVIPRLMDNPRVGVAHARTIARDPRLTATVMLAIKKRDDWMKDDEVRFLFCKHPRAPFWAVKEVLPTLSRDKLRTLATNVSIQPQVRRKAQSMIGVGVR